MIQSPDDSMTQWSSNSSQQSELGDSLLEDFCLVLLAHAGFCNGAHQFPRFRDQLMGQLDRGFLPAILALVGMWGIQRLRTDALRISVCAA